MWLLANVGVRVATKDGEELTMVEVKGDQANGALTGGDAEDARAPDVPCSFFRS